MNYFTRAIYVYKKVKCVDVAFKWFSLPLPQSLTGGASGYTAWGRGLEDDLPSVSG